MKYKYCVRTGPPAPKGLKSPIPDARDVEAWLNEMADNGLEFIGMGTKRWNWPDMTQEWWIFRRSITEKNK